MTLILSKSVPNYAVGANFKNGNLPAEDYIEHWMKEEGAVEGKIHALTIVVKLGPFLLVSVL